MRTCWPLLAAFVLIGAEGHADWVTAGFFSERSKIDSIERFLVIPDHIDSSLFGWEIVRAGDLNSDSIEDIIIGRSKYEIWQDNNFYLFYGGNPPDASFDREFTQFGIRLGNIGDVTGDGYDDFRSIKFPDMTFHFDGSGLDDSADFTIPNVVSLIAVAADFDEDGNLELPLSTDVNGGYVHIYDIDSTRDTIPEYIIPDTAASFGRNLAVGDFNGDGVSDLVIAAFANRDTNFVKFYWGGPGFDTVADFQIKTTKAWFGEYLVPLSDYNGDGFGDIFIAGTSPNRFGVYYGGPGFDDEIDLVINIDYLGGYYGPNSVGVAGDVNSDGYPDLVLGRLLIGIEEVFIYLGGPDADSSFDVQFDSYDVPGPQEAFGQTVAGIGDFNGDGIADFAVRSQTQTGCCWTSEVNLFAGWDSHGTSVEYDYDPALPQELRLSHNYPNPFNPLTHIEFDLPHRSYVTLEIFNVLGEKVVKLLDKRLAAGRYSIHWDGRDSRGRSVASGVYLYRLTAGDFSQTRKMVLMR